MKAGKSTHSTEVFHGAMAAFLLQSAKEVV